MIKWSILVGLLGVIGTGFGTVHRARRKPNPRPEMQWLLGIAALLPAWLIAFLGLLGPSTGGRPEKALAISWVLSSSVALLGVIVTDAVLRRLRESGRNYRPVTYWLLGVVALVPGWGIALLVLMAKTMGR
jgi:hypothetical protein